MLRLNILPDFETIRMDQDPKNPKWKIEKVYKMSANGGLLEWQVGFDGLNQLELSHGYVNGVVNTTPNEVKLNSSNKSMQEQALQDARQRYKLKYNEGYMPAGSTDPPQTVGMKGYEYAENRVLAFKQNSGSVYTQPKFDGIRMLCQNVGNRITTKSWKNTEWTHITHIQEELQKFFMYLPKYATLDGEMYHHGPRFSFNEISGMMRATVNINPNIVHLQYYIFDVDYQDSNGTPYEKRYELLVNAYKRYLQDNSPTNDANDISVAPKTFVIVPCQIARNHAEVMQQFEMHLSNGYEGIMIKQISNGAALGTEAYNLSIYKKGRCNNILKFKPFIDEEGLIIGVLDSEGTEKGAARLVVQDVRGNKITIRMKGSVERRREWLKTPALVVGKEVTYRYLNLSETGVPRHPRGIEIRDYE